MGFSYEEMRAYAANPLHKSLARWRKDPVQWGSVAEQAEAEAANVRWHFRGLALTNAEALERAERAIELLQRVAGELRQRIEEGNP